MTKNNPLLQPTPETQGEGSDPTRTSIVNYHEAAERPHAEGYPEPTEAPAPGTSEGDEPEKAPVRTTEPVPTGTEDMPEFEIPPSVTQEIEYPDTNNPDRYFENDYVVEVVNKREDDEERERYEGVRREDGPEYTATHTEDDDREKFIG